MFALSSYEWRARVTPGLLAIAPIAATIVTLGVKDFPAISAALGLAATAVGGYFLSAVVGNAGRRAEPFLYERWGGRPTTQLLRTRGEATNPTQCEIWRSALTKATGVELLSKRREAANPEEADRAIETATDLMRHLTHGASYPAVAHENAAYGLERNLWGFRWVGRLIALTCLAAVLLAYHLGLSRAAAIVGSAIALLFLLGWVLIPSRDRARTAGFRYAFQLLNAVAQSGRANDQPNTSTSPPGASPGPAREGA
jgi:hypothetical protein